jgi:hypothetical protein
MNYKEEIKKILAELKNLGFTRRMIEKELGCNTNYIDQVLSRGGNKTFYAAIQRFQLLQQSKRNLTDASQDDIILALRAAVHVLTLKIVELETKLTKGSSTKISLEVQRMMQQQKSVLQRGIVAA